MLKKLKNKKLLIITVLAVLLLLSMFFMTRGKTVKVSVEEIKRGEIASSISTSGVVKAKTADLGSSLGGRIEEIYAKEGEKVQSGKLLAILESYDQAKNDYDRIKELFGKGFASRQQLENAKTLLESKRIVSPINGVVAKVDLDKGEVASPTVPFITVVNPNDMWIEIQIDEVDIPQISIGQKAKIFSEAYPDEHFMSNVNWVNYKAELKKIAGMVRMDEDDMIFRATVSIPKEARNKFRSDMSLNVDLLTKEKKGVLLAPRTSIMQNKKREMVVFVVKSNKAKETPVEIGIKDSNNVEVLSGLSEGDWIATSNLSELNEGETKVKIQKK